MVVFLIRYNYILIQSNDKYPHINIKNKPYFIIIKGENMKLTELYGKQIYSLYEGEILATISGACFSANLNKIKSFKVFDQEENEFSLPIANIKAMSDFVIVSNKNKLDMYLEDTSKSPMFKLVLNNKANSLGKVVDAEINDLGIIDHFITDNNECLKPENIYIRKDFIFYSTTPICISNLRPKKKKIQTLSNINVNILNFEKHYSQENFIPKKLQYNPESILGKISKGDLFGLNNELIIKANQTITEKIVSDASRHNRLNQLFYLAI